ncbi:MAG: TRAP transporter substrate-binding protein [Desulfobacula sp.]|jgi:TRAP-type C4-dicarboxylate transport system substrate-binding protein
MKKLSEALIVSILFAALIYVAFPGASFAADATIKLNYSSVFPAPHKNSMLAESWCREVEKRTNGKVAVTYFPGGTLTPAAQIYDGVVNGISDIGFSVFAYSRGKFPFLEVIDLPLGYKSGVQATALVNELYTKFKPKELDEVKVLYLHAHGPGLVHSKTPISTLDDFKGKKIRASGIANKIVSSLGGVPVGTTMPETYEALRTGIVDGSVAPVESLKGWKWGEVVSSTTLNYASAYSTALFVVMNKEKWAALPPDVQKVFTEVNQEWTVKQGKTWDEIDAEGMEFIKARGNKIISLSPEEDAKWAEKVKPMLAEYVASATAKGLPGEEALKFCLDFLKK